MSSSDIAAMIFDRSGTLTRCRTFEPCGAISRPCEPHTFLHPDAPVRVIRTQ